MGKRPVVPPTDLQNYVTPPARRTIRKRKVSNGNIGHNINIGRPAKAVRLNSDAEDDEDSSSNDIQVPKCSSKHANNSSILLNSSIKLEQSSPATNDSPRPVYTLRPSVVNGTILYDLTQKPWRLGNPIGKGNFGEIFLASDNITLPVTNENAKFVVKIEPHSNGPLFVEIHCLMNTAKEDKNNDAEKTIKQENGTRSSMEIKSTPPSGIPDYIASGSHFFGGARYRFLVLQRFDQDLHSLIKNSCVSQKSILTLAIQIVNVLENLHDKGYCHNDVKSQNLMISKCKYYKNKNSTLNTNKTTKTTTNKSIKNASKYLDNYEEKQPTTDSGNSSEQEANDYDDDEDFVVKRKINDDDYMEESEEDDEDFDDGTTTSNSNSTDAYKTPVLKGRRNRRRISNRSIVQYSGSNPVRSCRRPQRQNSIYEEMVNSHYLRPSNKRISFAEFFDEDGVSTKGDNNYANGNGNRNRNGDSHDVHMNSTEDEDSNTFLPQSMRRRLENSSHTSATKRNSRTARNLNATSNKTKNSPQKRLTRRQEKLLSQQQQQQQQQQKSENILNNHTDETIAQQMVAVEAEHIFLIDFGLASKYIDRGVHRPFIMDQRRAHDGTLEFTSRDAHMGAHSRRSDLECLGYNLLYWSQGFLPWKDAAAQHQQEKVHRAKEYLMTDVREMLKQIYGKDVPKYLGEFLHLINQLAYHDRPQYARYRRLFQHEYQQLGYSLANMHLDSQEIARSCVRIKKDHGAGKHDFFEQNNKLHNSHILSIMKSGGTPFQERNSIGDRVSPKNLRSKSDKKSLRKKKFCWAEVLSQDPDQIARERAEKEFDRELNDEEERPVRRYEGNPTYAILDLIKKNEEKYKTSNDNENEQNGEESQDEVDEDEGEEDENIQEDEEENYETEASEVEAEASDDNEDLEDEAGEEDEAVSEDEQDESMQETDDEEDENETSQDEDDDNDDENESESDDENVDSDISEASSNSEQYGTRGRNKQRGNRNIIVSNQKATKGKTVKPARRAVSAANSRSSKSTTASSNASRCIKSRTLTKNIKKCTRSNGARTTTTKSINEIKQRQRSKRLGAKSKRGGGDNFNGGHAFAASAAGEIEQQALKQFLYDQSQSQQEPQVNINDKTSKIRVKRRRRQLKTESGSELMNGGGGGGSGDINARMLGVDDDSNSNLMLFNVWKTSNENIYARNAAAAAKSLTTATTTMITRHYRK